MEPGSLEAHALPGNTPPAALVAAASEIERLNMNNVARLPNQGKEFIPDDEKTHWKRLINPAYIGAYSLQPGHDLTVRIDRVVREIVKGQDGKEEECTVARLVDEKPFILNRTNSKSIAKLYGPYIEDWAGKDITLFATKTKVAKDVVECLRIRPAVTPRNAVKQQLSSVRFAAALASVRKGDCSAALVRQRFDLTTAQEAELLNLEAGDA